MHFFISYINLLRNWGQVRVKLERNVAFFWIVSKYKCEKTNGLPNNLIKVKSWVFKGISRNNFFIDGVKLKLYEGAWYMPYFDFNKEGKKQPL